MIWLWACAPKTADTVTAAEPSVDQPALGAGELVLLHTNDLHGHFLPEPADWLEGSPAIGGMAALDAWSDAIEAQLGSEGVLLLDGGDILTGTPLTDLEVRGAGGGAMLELMEAVGYDAWVVGNHEFDQGFDNLDRLITASAVPVVSSNVGAAEGGLAFERQLPSVVVTANGLRVGIIGATTEGLGYLVSPADWERLSLAPVAESVAAEVERLDPETDVIVALTHIGLDADRALAAAVSGLDVIVGGHSHTPLYEAEEVSGVIIVQAGSYGRSLGQLRLKVVDDEVVSSHAILHDLIPEAQPQPASADVLELVATYEAQIDAAYGEVIGEATSTLSSRYAGESSLGNWITDVLRESTGADIGLYNSGGLRADLRHGSLTLRSIYEVFPFGNAVVTFTITGEQLVRVLLANAAVQAGHEGGMISMSGVSGSWHRVLGAPELRDLEVNGEPLAIDATYVVATNSYVADQADRYLGGLTVRDLRGAGYTVFEAAVEAVRRGPVEAPPLGRLAEH